MSRLLLALSILLLSFISPTLSFAQYVQYGGVTTAQPERPALVEKKLLNPQNNQFVDNLNNEQHTFLPEQEVIFRVTVTNVTQSDLKNAAVTDKLPDILSFVSASFGNYDKNNKSINLTINALKPGESKTFEIKTKVKAANDLPDNVFCQTNLSRVTVTNMTDEDTATFCVSKQVLGITSELPKTGPGQTLLLFILASLFLAISLVMKRIIFLEGR